MKTIVCLFITAVLSNLPLYAIAAGNTSREACTLMATRTPEKLNRMKLHSVFWSRTETRQVYVIALRDGEPGVNKFTERHTIQIQDRTAIVMAAIATHNLSLLRSYYDTSINYYALRTVRSSPLVWSSMCNFKKGTVFLLKTGIDPNEYPGVSTGSFNSALLYKDSDIPMLLLNAGYDIAHNYQSCLSSKSILRKRRHDILTRVAKAIDHAVCKNRGARSYIPEI